MWPFYFDKILVQPPHHQKPLEPPGCGMARQFHSYGFGYGGQWTFNGSIQEEKGQTNYKTLKQIDKE